MKSRRRFLQTLGGLGIAGTFAEFAGCAARKDASHVIDGYGQLSPVADDATGQKLLKLQSFFCRKFPRRPIDHIRISRFSPIIIIQCLYKNSENLSRGVDEKNMIWQNN